MLTCCTECSIVPPGYINPCQEICFMESRILIRRLVSYCFPASATNITELAPQTLFAARAKLHRPFSCVTQNRESQSPKTPALSPSCSRGCRRMSCGDDWGQTCSPFNCLKSEIVTPVQLPSISSILPYFFSHRLSQASSLLLCFVSISWVCYTRNFA